MRHLLKPALIFICLIPNILPAQSPPSKFPPNRTETFYFADTARFREKNLEIGLALGVLHYQGDLTVDQKRFDGDFNPAGGIFLRRHLIPNLALRANVLAGQLSSQDLAYPTRGTTFKTALTEASLQAEWDIFGKNRFRRVDTVGYSLDRYQQIASINVFRHLLLPYVFVGASATSTKATATFNDVSTEGANLQERVAHDRLNGSERKTGFGLLFGGGLDFDLGRNWLLGGELGLHTSFSDFLDGVSFSGNPDRYDWFWAGGLHISYRLGKKDHDGDGIVDAKDRCPEIPGPGTSLGCPDADHDGIADRDDECPHRKGILALSGCPLKDADNDSVPDVDDLCPNLA
ncbi:MAG: thrombospondin type 3 repeat-containing protein, partial [Saprospiraceae bacterium]